MKARLSSEGVGGNLAEPGAECLTVGATKVMSWSAAWGGEGERSTWPIQSRITMLGCEDVAADVPDACLGL